MWIASRDARREATARVFALDHRARKGLCSVQVIHERGQCARYGPQVQTSSNFGPSGVPVAARVTRDRVDAVRVARRG